MNHEDFDKLVREVERGIGKDQARLRKSVWRWAMVGYAGLFAGLALVVVISAGLIITGIVLRDEAWGLIIAGVFLLFLGGLAYLNTLRFHLPKPDGYPVAPAQAPELFKMLDELRDSLGSAPFHQVLIVPDFNAGVVQRPRLSVFGWYQNYLLLGLPVLENFSLDEVRAILAHEFTHLARSHGHSSQWIYRVRRSWEQIFPRFRRPQVRGQITLRPVLMGFVDWFWPRFNAHAFVLSRVHEYEADAASARLAGMESAATGLVRINLYGRLLDQKFWPALWQRANTEPNPPGNFAGQISEFLTSISGEANEWLPKVFQITTTYSDTHPCLSERVAAIGLKADPGQDYARRAIQRPGEPSAVFLLGAGLEDVRRGVQGAWQKECEPRWKQQHAKASAVQWQLSGLASAVQKNKAADVEALWEKARMVLQLNQQDEAIALLRDVVAIQPAHLGANLALGEILLARDDGQGETYLETAFREDEQLLPRGFPFLHGYFQRKGWADRIKLLYARMDLFEQSMKLFHQERQNVSVTDTFIDHDLSAADVEALGVLFRKHEQIERVWLAKKEMKYFVRQRFYVLCVQARRPWHRLSGGEAEAELVGQLTRTVKVPGRVFIFGARGPFQDIGRKMQRVGNAAIYYGSK